MFGQPHARMRCQQPQFATHSSGTHRYSPSLDTRMGRMLWTAGAIASRRAHACSQALCPLAGMVAAGGRSRTAVQQLAWSVGGVRGPKTSTRKVPVILLKDAPNLGFRGEEVAVRPGYARNFLIPQQV